MAQTLIVNVKNRIKLGDTKYGYIGTLTWAEYTGSGGSKPTTIGGAVSALPTTVDHCSFGQQGGYVMEYVPSTEKFKVYGSNKTEAAIGIEVADKADLKALTPTFFLIGS